MERLVLTNECKENSINRQTDRIAWIDIAKGYGILFVIFAHLDVGILGTWIYTFHMQLFFLLSGYVFGLKYDFRTFVNKKIHSIVIPYITLGIPMIIFKILSYYHASTLDISTIKELIVDFCLQRRFWTLWYIACLFWLNIIFYIIVSKLKKIKCIVFVSFMMFWIGIMYYHFGGKSLPWNIDVCLTAILFFAVGFWLKNNYINIREKITIISSVILFIFFGVINLIFGYLGIKIAGYGMEMFGSRYGFPPLTIISAFAGIFCVIIFSHWFNLSFIKYIGRNSLLYYAWHQTIIMPLVTGSLKYVGVIRDDMTTIEKFLEKIIELIIIVLVLTICNMVISKTKLKFMLGR